MRGYNYIGVQADEAYMTYSSEILWKMGKPKVSRSWESKV